MIDGAYQGKGCGKEAFRLAPEYVRTNPCGDADYCRLSCEPENEATRTLYRSFGLEEQALPEGRDAVPAVLTLS